MVIHPFYSSFVLCLFLSSCHLSGAVKDLEEKYDHSTHVARHENAYKLSHGGDEAEKKIERIKSLSGFIIESLSGYIVESLSEFPHDMNVDEHYNDMQGEDVGVFTLDDVLRFHAGRKIKPYFFIRNPDLYPGFLPREVADSIPFSSSNITKILQFFSISPDSLKGQVVKKTLEMCGLKSPEGETKICATSRESMVEFLKNAFGDVDIKLIGTTHPTMKTPIVQSYTIVGPVREIKSPRKVACHPTPYLYSVYMCHYDQISKTKVFKVPLVGDNGDKVDALVVCHLDSKNFSPNHPAFKLLGTKHGEPLCHIFNEGHGVWVQSSTPPIAM